MSVALFFLVIVCGLLGRQAPEQNFAPTFVWIIWWVGLSFFTALVGNVWPLINPWKVLFEWAEAAARRAGKRLELSKPYPDGLDLWPALTLYAGFIWVELVFEGSSTPLDIALLAILYSLLTWAGMVVFGKDVWLRRSEAFSVYFGILARFAPTEVRVTVPDHRDERCGTAGGQCVNCYECFARAAPEERGLYVRPWAVGLGFAKPASPGGLIFIVFVLASVTYDSLLVTPLWSELVGLVPLSRTLGTVALPVLFLVVYLGFVKLSQFYGGSYVPFRHLAAVYVYSLVPIAIAYQVAHYYTFLIIQGQAILPLLSDPFGWGWNLFSTAGYRIHAGLFDAAFVWYSQVALVVVGHVIAVYLAHVVALRLLRHPRLATRSQYPMLALMILYTIFSLWILSQPTVEN
ncbi:MAG TPA: hypothetical protein VK869_00350 [Rubrobacteraceae bacterium]|nr:hypothetical protein [Rubrobacteraceae bacterium]